MNTPIDLTDKRAPELLDNRSSNEREVLSLIRQHGALPKATISKMTGLSAQSATVIIKKLEADNLVKRLPAEKGAVGQPKIPFALNESGAFGVGLKIGRRSYDMTLIDFTGQIVNSIHETVHYPSVGSLLAFAQRAHRKLIGDSPDGSVKRVLGMGVAMPFSLWEWAEEARAPDEELQQWKQFDIQQRLGDLLSLPVFLRNDATAACSAELSFGNSLHWQHFLYIFVGAFVGGGIVLNGRLISGKGGNAGAIGSMLLHDTDDSRQLITQSSLYLLESALNKNGEKGKQLFENTERWQVNEDVLTTWLKTAARGLAYASHSAMSLLDLEGVIIDGAMPEAVKLQLVSETQSQLNKLDDRGVSEIHVSAGEIGAKAQSIGSANLPLLANYARHL
ncbi:ROK family transcriptional regulator [Alteromonas gracilis]|uniref:ROK family transcriptional regulator n=1 Tax=Alteromonas gracilis TaxID=1479524 RepID=UPI0030CA7245